MDHTVVLAGTYNYALVAVSVLVAILAAYAALELAGRITATRGGRSQWQGGSCGSPEEQL